MGVFFGLLIGLEIKHYAADYFLQPAWMLRGKGDITHPGGHAHAGFHAAMTFLILVLFGTPAALALAICAGEFVIHYGLDYAKVAYSRDVHIDRRPRRFWTLHGIDQLAHQLTYAAIIFIALRAQGLI